MSELKKEWYVVNTYAGQENRVKENLERRVKTMGLEDSLFQRFQQITKHHFIFYNINLTSCRLYRRQLL